MNIKLKKDIEKDGVTKIQAIFHKGWINLTISYLDGEIFMGKIQPEYLNLEITGNLSVSSFTKENIE